MLPHMLCQSPAHQPMKDIMDLTIVLKNSSVVLNASIIGGFPLADIPHSCLSAIVISDNGTNEAQKCCDELLDMSWVRRADFIYQIDPLFCTYIPLWILVLTIQKRANKLKNPAAPIRDLRFTSASYGKCTRCFDSMGS
ncbi:MAG TPA: hypothetical protein ENI07_06760 [Desulfobacterales bacterium]|nr:hypothetical protein [Desulfobacterales bacterium]